MKVECLKFHEHMNIQKKKSKIRKFRTPRKIQKSKLYGKKSKAHIH